MGETGTRYFKDKYGRSVMDGSAEIRCDDFAQIVCEKLDMISDDEHDMFRATTGIYLSRWYLHCSDNELDPG